MTKYIFLFLFSVLLVGCAPNRALKYFEKEEFYAKALQYTNKCDIVYEDQVKVMVTATYLNSVDSQWNDENENFIVGVYVVETENNNRSFYPNEAFDLTLNNSAYITINSIKKENEMFHNTPLYNPWADYFMVKFKPAEIQTNVIKVKLLNNTYDSKKQKEELPKPYELKLKLNHTTLGSCEISFQEE